MVYLLPQLLTRQAEAQPHRPAVMHSQSMLTYSELETQSNQVAQALHAAGVMRGDRVGLYLNKSLEAVVALFGIMKVGAAYVPLDPKAPPTRIAFIVHNCQMKGLVSSSKDLNTLFQIERSRLSSLHGVILNDDKHAIQENLPLAAFDWSQVRRMPDTPPVKPDTIEDDLAYILYTSGSTGTPKGVMISHRASLTFVNWACDTFQIQPEDRVSNHAPFHFDLSIFDIFSTIKGGGTIVLVPVSLSVFPTSLAKFIADQTISVWYSVPSALTRLVLYGQLEQHNYSHLRAVLFAGEVFPIKYLRTLMEQIPHPHYYNLYGPTETNVCTYYEVPPLAPERTTPLPIGQACDNFETFLLTPQNTLAAPQEEGELCVRGPGLMKGYWGLPEKTQAVLHPFELHPHLGPEPIYRTGDLAQQDATGNYLYLGRRDNMIKSRGYRIELGEIETVLYTHPDVLEAAVIPVPDDEIGNRIRAVIAVQNDDALETHVNANQLQAHCAQHLPTYMIPHEIVFCAQLPKTSTGKIDKNRLQQHKMVTSHESQSS